MIAGSHDEMDFFFHHAGLLATEADLMPALVVPPAARDHREITARRFMEVAVVGGVVFDVISGHTRAAVSFPNAAMTPGAHGGTCICVIYPGLGKPQPSRQAEGASRESNTGRLPASRCPKQL